MRRSRSAFVLTASITAVAIVAMSVSGMAWAKGPKPPKASKVTCTTLTGTITATSDTVGGCSGQGGTGTFTGFGGVSGSATITWASGVVNTFSYATTPITSGKKDKCGVGWITVPLKGAITSNTSLPAGNGGVKGAVKASICVDPSGNLTLEKGVFKF